MANDDPPPLVEIADPADHRDADDVSTTTLEETRTSAERPAPHARSTTAPVAADRVKASPGPSSREASERKFADVFKRDEDYRMIYRYFAKGGFDKSTVEELTQTTFEHATRSFKSWSDDGRGTRPWLFTIARNTKLDFLRRQKTWTQFIGDVKTYLLGGLLRNKTPDPSPAHENSDILAKVLAKVSAKDREIVELHYLDGLTPAEIALVLGIEQDAVRKRLSRARARLQQHLDELEVTSS